MEPLKWIDLLVFLFVLSFVTLYSQEQISLVSEKASVKEKITLTEVVAKDGAKIEVERLADSIFALEGKYFKPHESIDLISHSYSEIAHFLVTADENGNTLKIIVLPAVIGKSGGISHVEVLREEEFIHIKLPWGTEALKS